MKTKLKTSTLLYTTTIRLERLDNINRERGIKIRVYHDVRVPATDQDVVKFDKPVGDSWQYLLEYTYNGVADPDDILIESGSTANEMRKKLENTLNLLLRHETVIFEESTYP